MARPVRGGGIDSYRDQEGENRGHAYDDQDHHQHQAIITTRAASDFVVYQDPPEEPQGQHHRSTTMQRGHQRLHQQQQQQHPGDMSGVDLYDENEAALEGAENGGGVEYCSDQENVQPTRRAAAAGGAGSSSVAAAASGVPVAPVRATGVAVGGSGVGGAGIAPVMDARQELMQRNKHTSSSSQLQQQQRRSSANIELAGRSRSSQQQSQHQQHYVSSSTSTRDHQQLSGAVAVAGGGGAYREIPGAPGRKRNRDGEGEGVGYGGDQVGGAIVSSRDVERHHHSKRHLMAARGQEDYDTAQVNQAYHQARTKARQEPQVAPLTEQQLLEKQQRESALRKQRRAQVEELKQYNRLVEHIDYGPVYEDDTYEYRNVTLPKVLLRYIKRGYMERPEDKSSYVLRLLKESEWRDIGLRMSQYWVHYLSHAPEPHVLLFRRPVGTGDRLKQEQERKEAAMLAAAEAAGAASKKDTQRDQLRRTGSSSSSSTQQQRRRREEERNVVFNATSSESAAYTHQQQLSSTSGSSRMAAAAVAEAEVSSSGAAASQDNGTRRSRENTPPPAPKRSNTNKPRQ